MQRTSLLVAAALVVTLPSLALAKTHHRHHVVHHAHVARVAAPVVDQDPNTAFLRALGDLAAQLSRPYPGTAAAPGAAPGGE